MIHDGDDNADGAKMVAMATMMVMVVVRKMQNDDGVVDDGGDADGDGNGADNDDNENDGNQWRLLQI